MIEPHPKGAPRRSKRALRRLLLEWFDRHRRDLPWRKTGDAYAIWVSEVMLQQTQVAAVIPYWERFLQRFPDVKALAEAPLSEVLSLWSGLGYYSRARNLHRAAQQIANELGGNIPGTAEALRKLPGFGPYTAGAVASMAFGEPAALVDGNVARVFARLFVVEGAPGNRAREKRLWALAQEWVSGDRPGDWNQALMELGATVCRPDRPQCLLCPMREHCGAKALGLEFSLPPPKVRAPRKQLNLAVAVWQREDAVLLGRRAENGLFGGLWELPSAPYPTRDAELLGTFSELLGCSLFGLEHLGTVHRTLTHRDLELQLFRVTGADAPGPARGTYLEFCWTTGLQLSKLGLSTAMAEALRMAGLSVKKNIALKRQKSTQKGRTAQPSGASAAELPSALQKSARHPARCAWPIRRRV